VVDEFGDPLKLFLKSDGMDTSIPEHVSEGEYKEIIGKTLYAFARTKVGGIPSATWSLATMINSSANTLVRTRFVQGQGNTLYETFQEAEAAYKWVFRWLGLVCDEPAPWALNYLQCLYQNSILTTNMWENQIAHVLRSPTSLRQVHQEVLSVITITSSLTGNSQAQQPQQHGNRGGQRGTGQTAPSRGTGQNYSIPAQHSGNISLTNILAESSTWECHMCKNKGATGILSLSSCDKWVTIEIKRNSMNGYKSNPVELRLRENVTLQGLGKAVCRLL
jgi:hypothetical protein